MALFGSLFGDLFGNLFRGNEGSIKTVASYPVDDEFIQLAIELIDEFIPDPNTVWLVNAEDEITDSDKPWIVETGETETHNTRILFLQDTLEDRQLLKYLKGTTSNAAGQVNGIMYRTDFEPSLKDTVCKNIDEQILTVNAIDPLGPISKPIIYMLEFGT